MSPLPQDEHFDQLAAGYFDQVLDEASQAEFKALLQEDDQRVKRFAELAQLDQMINSEIAYQHEAQRFGLPVSPSEGASNFAAWREQKAKQAAAAQRKIRRKRMFVGGAIAAALLLATALLAIVFTGESPEPQVVEQQTNEPDATNPVFSARVVATLTNTHDAQWDQASLVRGSEIRAGDHLTLTAGFAEITTERGAVVILEAPATVEFTHNENAIRLYAGKLVGICETESSKGFLVGTPHMDIVDLGTRFGASADVGGSAKAAVFEGEVQVQTVVQDANAEPHKVVLVAGQQLLADSDGQLAAAPEPIALDHGFVGNWNAIHWRVGIQRQARFLQRPPVTVEHGKFNDPDHLIVFQESIVTLAEPIAVWPSLQALQAPTTVSIPAGQKVVSYFLHFSPNKRGKINATLTFPGRILGIVGNEQQFFDSHAIFGLDAVQYGGNSPEISYTVDVLSDDAMLVSGDQGNVLKIHLGAGTHSDQARVLIQVPDTFGEQP